MTLEEKQMEQEILRLKAEKRQLYDMLEAAVNHILSGKLGTGMLLSKAQDLMRRINPDE